MDTLRAVLKEVLAAQPLAATGTWILWVVLGGLGGLALAVGAWFAADRLGAWRLGWRHAKWLRVLGILWLLGSFAVLGSSFGGCEGGYRAARNALDLAEVRAGSLRSAADVVGGGLLALDAKLQEREGAKPPADLLERFAKGEARFDAAGFRGRLERAEADFVRSAVTTGKAQVCASLGVAPSGVIDGLVGVTLEFLLRRVLRSAAEDGLKKAGLSASVDGFFGALDAAGGGTRSELSSALVDRSFVPLLLMPVRSVARSGQAGALLGMAGAFALPLLGFWIARTIEARKSGSAAPPALSSPPTATNEGGSA